MHVCLAIYAAIAWRLARAYTILAGSRPLAPEPPRQLDEVSLEDQLPTTTKEESIEALV